MTGTPQPSLSTGSSTCLLFSDSRDGTRLAERFAIAAPFPVTLVEVGHAVPTIDAVGRSLLRRAGLVVGACLDSLELLALNRACAAAERPWLLAQPLGRNARFIRLHPVPDAPCYACTLDADQWLTIRNQRDCRYLPSRAPETPRIQADQKALDFLADAILRDVSSAAPVGVELFLRGATGEVCETHHLHDPDCCLHAPVVGRVEAPGPFRHLTVRTLVELARKRLGADAVVELGRELVRSLDCPACREETPCFLPWLGLTRKTIACPRCARSRAPRMMLSLGLEPELMDLEIASIGIPADDRLIARAGQARIAIALPREDLPSPANWQDAVSGNTLCTTVQI